MWPHATLPTSVLGQQVGGESTQNGSWWVFALPARARRNHRRRPNHLSLPQQQAVAHTVRKYFAAAAFGFAIVLRAAER
ncbi:hypothetical protein HaLaN_24151, partial [Haematococcus lacustris]